MIFKFTISRLITPLSKSLPRAINLTKNSSKINNCCSFFTKSYNNNFKPLSLSFLNLNIRSFSSDSLTKEQVEERVFNVLKAFDKIPATSPNFTTNSSFTSDLGLDSLDVVEVIMAVEEEFGMEIPDEAADEFKTPQEVIDYIHTKLHKH